ncbi:hypothetical protein J6590_072225 [Homalodisca vitripennis]|nr:hypothetical protein J6590_072225 [Homalodisca vitripennis]
MAAPPALNPRRCSGLELRNVEDISEFASARVITLVGNAGLAFLAIARSKPHKPTWGPNPLSNNWHDTLPLPTAPHPDLA